MLIFTSSPVESAPPLLIPLCAAHLEVGLMTACSLQESPLVICPQPLPCAYSGSLTGDRRAVEHICQHLFSSPLRKDRVLATSRPWLPWRSSSHRSLLQLHTKWSIRGACRWLVAQVIPETKATTNCTVHRRSDPEQILLHVNGASVKIPPLPQFLQRVFLIGHKMDSCDLLNTGWLKTILTV